MEAEPVIVNQQGLASHAAKVREEEETGEEKRKEKIKRLKKNIIEKALKKSGNQKETFLQLEKCHPQKL